MSQSSLVRKAAAAAASTSPSSLPPSYIVTQSVLLQTSVGAFTVDLYGADFPEHVSQFCDSVRSQLYHDVRVTAIIPDHAVLLSHPPSEKGTSTVSAAPMNFYTLAAAGCTPSAPQYSRYAQQRHQRLEDEFKWAKKRRRCPETARDSSGSSSSSHAPPRYEYNSAASTGSLSRSGGLLFVLAPQWLRGLSELSTIGITLTRRQEHVLERDYIVIGEVKAVGMGGSGVETDVVLRRLRGLPHQKAPSASSGDQHRTSLSALRAIPSHEALLHCLRVPLRRTRVHGAAVLPLAGMPIWEVAQWLTTQTSPSPPPLVMEVLTVMRAATPAPPIWANHGAVIAANTRIGSLLNHPQPTALPPDDDSEDSGSLMLMREAGVVTWRVSSSLRKTEDGLLSSEDDDEPHNSSSGAASARQQRRQDERESEKERVIDTLSLAMNVLDGIAVTDPTLIAPCERTMFICRLNPITTSDGLAKCFASFGKVMSSEVKTDEKTGNSLGYGFITFETRESCFDAINRMNGALIDDRRVVTSFSQSVRRAWTAYQREQQHSTAPGGTAMRKRVREGS